MKRHGLLLTAWLVCLAFAAIGMTGAGMPVLFAQLASMVLSVMTASRVEQEGVLRRRWLYRGTLVLLLAMASTTVITAGSTVVFGEAERAIGGYIVLAVTNLIAMIATWRALVRPAPRRAALVGMFVVVLEIIAILVDIVMNFSLNEPRHTVAVAILASYAATWAGSLVCVAVLLSFEPAETVRVPDARVVEDD